MREKRFFISFIASFFFLTPLFSFAQTADEVQSVLDNIIKDSFPTENTIRTNSISDLLDIKNVPQNPGPNEMVQVTIESYITDLNKAIITWSVDGTIVSRGIGKTSFSFKNGASGETKRVAVSIVANTGEKTTKELIFNPVGVTILWEANTYTPPFYKGKPLMSPQAWVRVIAVPDVVGSTKAISPQNLVYVWKKNGTAISEASGYGKSSYSFFGPKPGRDLGLRVGVSSLDDSIQSEMQVDVPLTDPFVLFYENHPLLGIWNNRPLGETLSLSKKDFTVTAEPYFFSNKNAGNASLTYDWSLNGKSIANLGRSASLRNEKGTKGTSKLSLTMRNVEQTFQIASQSLTINFTTDESARPNF